MSDTEVSTPVADSGPSLASPGVATSDDIAATWAALEKEPEAPASDAGADSSPAQPDSPAPSRDAATTAPPEDSGSGVPPSTQGPIPYERHTAILDNARTKARQEAETEYRAKYGWAERYDPQVVEQSSRLYQWLTQDPQGFAGYLQQQLQSQAPAKDEMPEPDLRAEDGTPVYSAPQLQKYSEWQQRQWQKQVEQQVAPLQQMAQQMQARELQQRTQVQASGIVQDARANWPMFGDLEKDVKAKMIAHPEWSLHEAYIASFRENGVVRMEEKWRQQQAAAVTDKASAATTKPGVQPATPRDYRDMETRDIVKDVWAQFEQGGGR